MKLLPILAGFLALWCSACSAPRIDGASDEKFIGSVERVRASLPEARHKPFDDSLAVISTVIESRVDFSDVAIGAASMRAALRRALNGKTGEEVIAYADDLKRDVQQIPQVAKGNDGTTNDGARPPLVVGDSVDMSGNSFAYNVSAKFGEVELRRLHSELNGPAARAKLQTYVCRRPLPPFTITVVLWYEGPDQERQIRMQMTPPLYKSDGQIEAGIGYLFEHGVKELDKGSPIDYGYRRPLDGAAITPVHVDAYPEPAAVNCDSGDAQPR